MCFFEQNQIWVLKTEKSPISVLQDLNMAMLPLAVILSWTPCFHVFLQLCKLGHPHLICDEEPVPVDCDSPAAGSIGSFGSSNDAGLLNLFSTPTSVTRLNRLIHVYQIRTEVCDARDLCSDFIDAMYVDVGK